ncbi:DUF3626 domain-containing protein [Streptomyces sp. NBC_01014]|uniref:DUF3626 domain-containing protein n=1 Tax=Streptomyces sp. NBC_01014 TaxID=2903719 RepID=UPI003867398E|nr:DUF3626 domain-containing protein [Streptomyces sp. NBC_01014]
MTVNLPRPPHEEAIRHVAALASGAPAAPELRVTLNFHPDRAAPGGPPLLRALAQDGVYSSQFVTGTSNGGLTAYPGGDRHRWESRIFGGAYDTAPARQRPVYGALNHRLRPVGGAHRFGSAHLRLRPETLARTTFCYPDSVTEPVHFGVAEALAPLIERADADQQDTLDDYVEAHLHGPLVLATDVEALVLDPSFRGTDVETAAGLLPFPVEWHPGFRLTVGVLRRHPEYRGPEYVALGAEIAEDGLLTPRVIGDAVRAGRHDPQDLKKVWHYVARFGN